MSRNLRISIIAIAAPVAICVWASVVFAMDRASNGGEVLGSVQVAGTRLGGLDEAQARLALLDLEKELAQMPITVEINGTGFELIPADIGFEIDKDAMLAEAMTKGRTGGITGQFGWWLGNLRGSTNESIALVTGFSRAKLDQVLERWEDESIADPPFEGGIEINGTTINPIYPRPGLGIDTDEAARLVSTALVDLDREPISVPTRVVVPLTSDEEVDDAVAEAQHLISGPVTLSRLAPEVRVVFDRDLLASALRTRVVGDEDPDIELYFDLDPLLTYLLGIRQEIEFPPVDAKVVARIDEEITIIPGRSALLIDDEAIAPAILAATRSTTRSGVFPYVDGEEPDLTTAEAEGMGIRHLLYRAVTFFQCCGDEKNLNRIQNINRIAEEVDGAIVMPGETFSLNEHVGQRTIEDGYARAGAIIGDTVQCCDHPANIGGGVSQFATTLYNAVFFAGLEDVSHTPHTLYFPRYPEGREATLGYPTPDVVFRNNTENAVLIDTDADDTSVTVRIYGDNGGLEVEAGLSERRNHTEPFEVYEANEEIPPGEEDVTTNGSAGWTVTVFRYITHPDGEQTTESWVWTYSPFPKIIEMHPCSLPANHEDHVEGCPAVVPGVVGRASGNAIQAINNVGLLASSTETFDCDPANRNNVVAQNPAGGDLVEPGSTVSITICRVEAGGGDGEGGGGGDG